MEIDNDVQAILDKITDAVNDQLAGKEFTYTFVVVGHVITSMILSTIDIYIKTDCYKTKITYANLIHNDVMKALAKQKLNEELSNEKLK